MPELFPITLQLLETFGSLTIAWNSGFIPCPNPCYFVCALTPPNYATLMHPAHGTHLAPGSAPSTHTPAPQSLAHRNVC